EAGSQLFLDGVPHDVAECVSCHDFSVFEKPPPASPANGGSKPCMVALLQGDGSVDRSVDCLSSLLSVVFLAMAE
ncbi:MAG: hypothetical protein AB7O38_24160, partial [Pirellulaceae bacterium]